MEVGNQEKLRRAYVSRRKQMRCGRSVWRQKCVMGKRLSKKAAERETKNLSSKKATEKWRTFEYEGYGKVQNVRAKSR